MHEINSMQSDTNAHRIPLAILLAFLLCILHQKGHTQPFNSIDKLYQPGLIVIGDDINYPPYSFIDDNGQPAGFNIDIAKAVGKEMGLEVVIRQDNWEVIREALENGEIDAISGMFYSDERAIKYGFSSRHSVSNGDVFTANNISVSSLADLKGKKVVAQTADIYAEYLSHLDLDIHLIEVSTVKEALTLVENGIYDYAVVLKLPGLYSINSNKFQNVKPAGLSFLPKDYCMAVRKENEDLLYILNTGLHILKASEQYDQIHGKWLGVYEEKNFSDFLREHKWIIILIGSIIFTLLALSVTLRYLISKKTKELQTINKELKASNEEIVRKNKLLASSQTELKARLEKINKQGDIIRFKQNFLANMSHEIRTPLTGVMGIIDIMGQTPLSAEQTEYINILKHSSENLREIINQVLDYSRIEAGRLQLKKTIFPFKDLKNQARTLFQGLAGNKLAFESYIDPDIPDNICGDKIRITQIINNLISNGIKFTPEGVIKFKAEKIADISDHKQLIIKISITDTGLGILKEKQKALFEPFAQIHQSDYREYEGTGLGLSICKELAKLHGGDIGLQSQYGKGSTFWFTFKTECVGNDQSVELYPQSAQLIQPKTLRILLVEDKIVNQKVMKLLLTSFGHSVDLAENGAIAFEIFQPGKYDVILMDIQMPVMDGITATRKLRETHENLPPIIGLSANAFEGDREKYMKLGLDEYLTKPLKKEEFLQALESVKK
jgi:signal transduction histidine kinase/CheY-like chemotaxis protein